MKSARLAALHLAALAKSDRVWLMAQLTDTEKSTITPHLDEALAIDPRRLSEVIDEITQQAERSALRAKPSGNGTLLDDMPAQVLDPTLDRIPLAAVSILLERRAGAWSKRYLDRKNETARRRLAQNAAVSVKRISAAFIDRLEEYVSAKDAMNPARAPTDRFERVLRAAERAPARRPA